MLTPSSVSRSISIFPLRSSPTFPIIETEAPNRAAATAWFAPFPPGDIYESNELAELRAAETADLAQLRAETDDEVRAKREALEQDTRETATSLAAQREALEAELSTRQHEAAETTRGQLESARSELATLQTQLTDAREEHQRLVSAAQQDAAQIRANAERQAGEIVVEAEQRAQTTWVDAENRATKVLAAAEDRMTQLKVERGAVARYFESLGEVLGNAQKMNTVAENFVERTVTDTGGAPEAPEPAHGPSED